MRFVFFGVFPLLRKVFSYLASSRLLCPSSLPLIQRILHIGAEASEKEIQVKTNKKKIVGLNWYQAKQC